MKVRVSSLFDFAVNIITFFTMLDGLLKDFLWIMSSYSILTLFFSIKVHKAEYWLQLRYLAMCGETDSQTGGFFST